MTTRSTLDVTVPVDVLRALVAAVTVDAKTGLLACHAWRSQTAALLRAAEGPIAFYMIDLDRFGDVNAAVGHLAADTALVHVAQALRTTTGPMAAVGRFGGDEFVASVRVADIETARRVGQQMCDRVAEPSTVPDSRSVHRRPSVTASVGAVFTHSSATDPTRLLWAADSALYAAKRAGGNRICVVDGDGDTAALSQSAGSPAPDGAAWQDRGS